MKDLKSKKNKWSLWFPQLKWENRLRQTSNQAKRSCCCPCCVNCACNKTTAPISRLYQAPQSISDSSTLSYTQRPTTHPRTRFSMLGSFDSYTKQQKTSSSDNLKPQRRSQRPSSLGAFKLQDKLRPSQAQQRRAKQSKDQQRGGNLHSKHVKNIQRDTNDDKIDMKRVKQLTQIEKTLKGGRQTQSTCNKPRYSYSFGARYPSVKIGHNDCVIRRGKVPCNMGWLWNVPTLGINQVNCLFYL